MDDEDTNAWARIRELDRLVKDVEAQCSILYAPSHAKNERSRRIELVYLDRFSELLVNGESQILEVTTISISAPRPEPELRLQMVRLWHAMQDVSPGTFADDTFDALEVLPSAELDAVFAAFDLAYEQSKLTRTCLLVVLPLVVQLLKGEVARRREESAP
jgi:hypothetical protein